MQGHIKFNLASRIGKMKGNNHLKVQNGQRGLYFLAKLSKCTFTRIAELPIIKPLRNESLSFLTSPILLAKVGKPPDISQSYTKSKHCEKELYRRIPCNSFFIYHINCHSLFILKFFHVFVI